jgi:hypothetical protein
MKSNVAPKLSVIDALTAGLTTVARRPWLIVVPVAIDLVLWLAPRLSINSLALKFFAVWEALVRAAYTPTQMASMGDMIDAVREVTDLPLDKKGRLLRVVEAGQDARLLLANQRGDRPLTIFGRVR